MIFNNASLLSYSHKPVFFGENNLNFSVEKQFSLKGNILDLTNFNGVSGIVSGLNDLINLSKSTSSLIINDVNFGSGYVSSINVDAGNWVRNTEYSAEIICFSTGSLSNLSGSYFSGLSSIKTANSREYIKDLNEKFTITQNTDGIYEYSHDFEIAFENAFANLNPQIDTVAKNIANTFLISQVPIEILNNEPANFYTFPRKYYAENFDLVNKTFKFTETFSRQNSNSGSNIFYKYKALKNTDDIINISESIELQGIADSTYSNAISSLDLLRPTTLSRCQNFYNLYYDSSSGSLNSSYVSQGYEIDRFIGSVTLETTYTDDPFFAAGYKWSLEFGADLSTFKNSLDCVLDVEGSGQPGNISKYNNALVGFNIRYLAILDKINILYNSIKLQTRTNSPYFGSLNKSKESISSSVYEGKINYTVEYDDRGSQGDGLSRREYTQSVSNTVSVDRYSEYYVNNTLIREQKSQSSLNEIEEKRIRCYNKKYKIDSYEDVEDIRINTNNIISNETLKISPVDGKVEYSLKTLRH